MVTVEAWQSETRPLVNFDAAHNLDCSQGLEATGAP